jgi:hypothetical protein
VPSKSPATPKPALSKPVVAKTPAAKRVAGKTAEAASKPVKKLAPSVPAKPTPLKPVAAKKTSAVPKRLDPAQRANYVEVAAFYIAERRGFATANSMDDWLAAEAEIDRMIASGHFGQ